MESSRCDEVSNDVLRLLQPAKSGDLEHWRDWHESVGVARIVTKAELSDSQATVNLFAAMQMIVMKTMLKVLFDESPYLTDDELVERRTTMTQFWTSPYRMIIDHSDDVAQWHSVVRAGVATPEIFDLVLDAGADITAWCEPTNDSLPEEEEELRPSQLCISTPVHAAIASKNHVMLPKLFESGISPNARALMAGNQALTPAQYAIMLGDLETYTLLRDHGADSSITTPVLNTHALHFAAAHLRIDLMEATRQDLSGAAAPVTNMGHTPLHIACLPFNRGDIQTSSGKTSQSIRDIRYMSPVSRRASRTIPTYNESGEENLFWEPVNSHQTQERQRRLANSKDYQSSPWQWSRDPRKDHAKQEAVCKYILATYRGGPKVSDADKHGNNMLHYLAAAEYPNAPLIDWARQQEGGEHAWSSERNFWGHTAEEPHAEGNNARDSDRERLKDTRSSGGERRRGRFDIGLPGPPFP